ncbi:MAG TPA: cbb3-type cytochrome c oxidase subunit I [Gemmatimonadaceae bacterium]|nr:cbb3-type cytochrome c oxidase subunit I [Gemmatimonadaceae bacterium]
MHSLVRRYLKTAILFLATGLLIGGWMIVQRELIGTYPSPYIVSAHTHAILVGFVMMMILGVALWLFPRPDKSDERYQPRVADVAYWLLAIGTATRIAGELSRIGITSLPLRWIVVLASFAQIAGIGLFFYTMWSRIRPVGSRAREERGERF